MFFQKNYTKSDSVWANNKKLYVVDRLYRNQLTGFCFHLFAMIETCAYLYSSNFTPQVKEARNQSQIFNRKSISCDTTQRQSYHLIQIESVWAIKFMPKINISK